jgi:hypothetical protein
MVLKKEVYYKILVNYFYFDKEHLNLSHFSLNTQFGVLYGRMSG